MPPFHIWPTLFNLPRRRRYGHLALGHRKHIFDWLSLIIEQYMATILKTPPESRAMPWCHAVLDYATIAGGWIETARHARHTPARAKFKAIDDLCSK